MVDLRELEEDQRRALDRVAPLARQLGLYLAGGTALAFHLGHRTSRDLDLFSLEPHLDLEEVRRQLVATANAEVDSLNDATLHCRVDDVPVDVVCYPYPLLNPPGVGPRGVPVAGLEDLATMKLSAAARRGIRRDFWDLYEMFERQSPAFDVALEAYRRRFGVGESDLYHVLRALTYFDDAEADSILPRGLTLEKWQKIKHRLVERVRAALAARLA